MNTVYLDNAATTPVLPCAAEAAMAAMTQDFGNPSSLHHMGKRARDLLAEARGTVAQALGCRPEELYFTSGGTESSNTAILGAAAKNKHLGRHILSTPIEHEATLHTLTVLKTQGYEIELVMPDKLAEAIRPDTILVAMMAVNNETGLILPYAETAAALKKAAPGALFYLDAVQAFGKLELDLRNIDLLGLSAHKIGGMKGCGALYIRRGLKIAPLLTGGGQESGMRSGTEAVPQIAALAAACAYRMERRQQAYEHVSALRQQLLERLAQLGVPFTCNSPAEGSPYVVNLSACKGRSEVYLRALSEEGICVSGGSACARGKKSHVLLANKLPPKNIEAALRVSFSPETTAEDVEAFCQSFARAVKLF